MGACGKLALFAARIHAADAGNDARIGILIEPRQFALHLQGKFPRWRDDQGEGCCSPLEPLGTIKKLFCDGQPIGDGFARAGLRRNQQVAVGSGVRRHGGLDRRRRIVVALRQGSGERRTGGQECHEMQTLAGVWRRNIEQERVEAAAWRMRSRMARRI